MVAYMAWMSVQAASGRWDLYKVLGERQRLRLLALAAVEELSVGELAELLGESQPNVSRQLAPLRRLGLLAERKQGTRVLVQLERSVADDPVVADALRSGRALCEADGSLVRIPQLIGQRDAAAREFFSRTEPAPDPPRFPAEAPAYLRALSLLLPRRRLALDVGTGDGGLLDVLAPLFERVVGLDREAARLSQAQARIERRGYHHVSLMTVDVLEGSLSEVVEQHGLSDVVIASRLLHHAPRPAEMVAALGRLLSPEGTLLILDYAPHQDESLMREQADLWLGFSEAELRRYVQRAGLRTLTVADVPAIDCGRGPDSHLRWQVLAARRDAAPLAVVERNGEIDGG